MSIGRDNQRANHPSDKATSFSALKELFRTVVSVRRDKKRAKTSSGEATPAQVAAAAVSAAQAMQAAARDEPLMVGLVAVAAGIAKGPAPVSIFQVRFCLLSTAHEGCWTVLEAGFPEAHMVGAR